MDETTALHFTKQILEGLSHLHNLNGWVIHRDLKPANIIVNDWSIKIVDFWISKVIDFASLTSTGEQIWTWSYMSPEQVTDSKHIDRRSDLYTVWVILYEMLTGFHPYDYQSLPELINKIRGDEFYPIRPISRWVEVSNWIENIIML